jgi:hypothetical protein
MNTTQIRISRRKLLTVVCTATVLLSVSPTDGANAGVYSNDDKPNPLYEGP